MIAALAAALLLGWQGEPDPALIVADAERFAQVLAAHDGPPGASALERGYLRQATKGLRVMRRSRFRDADTLAAAIARQPDRYDHAVEVCLPAARDAQARLASDIQAIEALIPGLRAPPAYAVFGAGTSGGLATRDAIVVGLEVACDGMADRQAAAEHLSLFVAHEAVHAGQKRGGQDLLARVLAEGVADALSRRVTGATLNDAARSWFEAREDAVLDDFAAAACAGPDGLAPWLYAGPADRPPGWPPDLGYVIGEDIVRAHEARGGGVEDAMRAHRDARRYLAQSGHELDRLMTARGC